MRLAWFSPMPPVPSGVADCSAELVDALGSRHSIDVYIHADGAGRDQLGAERPGVRSAHEFVWRHRSSPYDLTVYQIGNSSHHDYIWPYLFRYPGLTVLHDVQLHHARAAALLRTNRPDDFRAEFAVNHPHTSVDLAELAVAGFDNHLYYYWPMHRLIVEASRLTAVHADSLADQLREETPGARVTAIRLGHGQPISEDGARHARQVVRERYGIDRQAILYGVFGGLTTDKRVPQILDALNSVVDYAPSAHLLLAGTPARHYDVSADVRARRLDDRVTITGYLATEEELTNCIAACDVSLNLRWPTAREVSGPWLRALAAGRPTITVDLAHLVDVPSLDPRTWRSHAAVATAGLPPASRTAADPVTVAVDILDEDHSLRLAMRRLATDPELRAALGRAGRAYWEREHSIPRMVGDYERAIAQAAGLPSPAVALPRHLVANGDRLLNEVLGEFAVAPVWK